MNQLQSIDLVHIEPSQTTVRQPDRQAKIIQFKLLIAQKKPCSLLHIITKRRGVGVCVVVCVLRERHPLPFFRQVKSSWRVCIPLQQRSRTSVRALLSATYTGPGTLMASLMILSCFISDQSTRASETLLKNCSFCGRYRTT